jgi:hypothetical protein
LIHFYRLETNAEPMFESVELAFIWDYIAVGNFINETISQKLGNKEKVSFLPQPLKYKYESIVAFPIRRVFTEREKDLDLDNIAFLSFSWV